jgi:hypothetical protein
MGGYRLPLPACRPGDGKLPLLAICQRQALFTSTAPLIELKELIVTKRLTLPYGQPTPGWPTGRLGVASYRAFSIQGIPVGVLQDYNIGGLMLPFLAKLLAFASCLKVITNQHI